MLIASNKIIYSEGDKHLSDLTAAETHEYTGSATLDETPVADGQIVNAGDLIEFDIDDAVHLSTDRYVLKVTGTYSSNYTREGVEFPQENPVNYEEELSSSSSIWFGNNADEDGGAELTAKIRWSGNKPQSIQFKMEQLGHNETPCKLSSNLSVVLTGYIYPCNIEIKTDSVTMGNDCNVLGDMIVNGEVSASSVQIDELQTGAVLGVKNITGGEIHIGTLPGTSMSGGTLNIGTMKGTANISSVEGGSFNIKATSSPRKTSNGNGQEGGAVEAYLTVKPAHNLIYQFTGTEARSGIILGKSFFLKNHLYYFYIGHGEDGEYGFFILPHTGRYTTFAMYKGSGGDADGDHGSFLAARAMKGDGKSTKDNYNTAFDQDSCAYIQFRRTKHWNNPWTADDNQGTISVGGSGTEGDRTFDTIKIWDLGLKLDLSDYE